MTIEALVFCSALETDPDLTSFHDNSLSQLKKLQKSNQIKRFFDRTTTTRPQLQTDVHR